MGIKENLLLKRLKDKLGNRQLLVASNREPYLHHYSGSKINWVKAVGGLTGALDPIMQAIGGTWIAHGSGKADREVVDGQHRLLVPPDNPRYTLRRIWLSKEEEEGYYYGYANQALWPLCHLSYCQPIFRAQDYQYYQQVNRYFAQVILEEIKNHSPPLIWLQDYHLVLCAKFIKEKAPHVTTSLFWHIPWPHFEVFRICPQKKELLEGLLANDLLGFHIQDYCHNFLETTQRELKAVVNWGELSVTYKGRKTWVLSLPLGIDSQAFLEQAQSQLVQREMKQLPQELDLPYEILAVSVERLDYTKGIIAKLKAIDRFLEKYPEYKGRFVFLESVALSRYHIKAYQQTWEEIKDLAEEINKKHRFGQWHPIVVIAQKLWHLSPKHLAYLRSADLFIVSSLHDGLNLTAKEFIMANVDLKGMLLLSQFAGAAEELKEAILINPFDTERFADAIAYALKMPEQEKKERLKRMRKVIQKNNVHFWASKFLETMLLAEGDN